jgi:hypothetical protein
MVSLPRLIISRARIEAVSAKRPGDERDLGKGLRSDENVKLFYEFCAETRIGAKWLCIVVRYFPGDAFVVTAYLTNSMKPGEAIWPKK